MIGIGLLFSRTIFFFNIPHYISYFCTCFTLWHDFLLSAFLFFIFWVRTFIINLWFKHYLYQLKSLLYVWMPLIHLLLLLLFIYFFEIHLLLFFFLLRFCSRFGKKKGNFFLFSVWWRACEWTARAKWEFPNMPLD